MKYDISWIMQSYLGEYPGSRADSDKKFIRAVRSFLAMKNPRTQLVIASDGCEITHELYYKHFKKHDNIAYVFVDKSTQNMYEKIEGQTETTKFYRGIPREAGRSIAEGYLIAYMDSDDFLMPNAAQIICAYWNANVKNKPDADYKWTFIQNWIENIAFENKNNTSQDEKFLGMPTGDSFKIKGLKSKWQKFKMRSEGNVLSSTWASVHRHDCNSKWKDHVSDPKTGGVSEDTIFWRSIRKEGKGFLTPDGFYVRCHYSGIWDY